VAGGALLVLVVAVIFVVGPSEPPEPVAAVVVPAPASASASPRTPWQLVALGDSVTAGAFCDCDPFPVLYARGLAARYDRGVGEVNEGEGGATSADLLAELRDASDPVRSEVADADIDVVTIGANDFGPQHADIESGDCGDPDDLACARDGLDDLQANLTAIVQQIRALRSGRPTAVLLTGYWNVFEDGDVAASQFPSAGHVTSQALTVAVNAVEKAVAVRQRAIYVDLFRPFVGADGTADPTDLLVDDGDHPNAKGHRAIAAAVLAVGVGPLPTG
jgi:lysophospholipase L1-like esterase